MRLKIAHIFLMPGHRDGLWIRNWNGDLNKLSFKS